MLGMDKKTLTFIGISIGSLILLIILIAVVVNLVSGRYKTYEQVENLLKEASKEYYKNRTNELPTEIGETVTISESPLVSAELIQPLDKILKDGKNCSADIIVTKTETDYNYKAYLDCGEAYRSIELYKVITDATNIVNTGAGLYQMNNEYIFRGEAKNNNVTISEKKWRIVKVDANNNIVLIGQFPTDMYSWDNRYNIDFNEFSGINDFNVSRAKDTLKKLFNGTDILTEEDKGYVLERKWCIGKRPAAALVNENPECSVLSEESLHFGMLTPYEYLNISLDANCRKAGDASCVNYNFISFFSGAYWTITGVSENSKDVFTIGSGGLNKKIADAEVKIAIVIYLKDDVMFNKGDGTSTNPYTLK